MRILRLFSVACLLSLAVTLPQAQTPGQAKQMQYIEIAKFELKPGISDQQFIDAEKSVREGKIRRQKGFISRELSKGSQNNWLMEMRIDTKENMDAWFVELKTDPAMTALGSMIEFSRVRMEFFVKQL